MPNQKNIQSVKDLSEKLSKAKSIYFTDYLGLNVTDVTNLRKKFFDGNVEYIVVKNTLLKIASALSLRSIAPPEFAATFAIKSTFVIVGVDSFLK